MNTIVISNKDKLCFSRVMLIILKFKVTTVYKLSIVKSWDFLDLLYEVLPEAFEKVDLWKQSIIFTKSMEVKLGHILKKMNISKPKIIKKKILKRKKTRKSDKKTHKTTKRKIVVVKQRQQNSDNDNENENNKDEEEEYSSEREEKDDDNEDESDNENEEDDDDDEESEDEESEDEEEEEKLGDNLDEMFSKTTSTQHFNYHENKFVQRVIKNKKPLESIPELNDVKLSSREVFLRKPGSIKRIKRKAENSTSNQIKKPKLSDDDIHKKFKNVQIKIKIKKPK